MILLIYLWIVLLSVCIILVRRSGSGTLLLAYFFGLSLIHVPGAINHLGETGLLSNEFETRVGFEAMLAGLSALLAGVWGYRLLVREAPPRLVSNVRTPDQAKPAQSAITARKLLAIGIVAYFVALPVAGLIPSITSIVSAFGGLLIVGYWVWLMNAAESGEQRQVLLALLSLPLLPFSTLITGGFVGFGIYWIIAVLALYFQVSRRRWILLIAAPFVAWAGLSLGVAYFEGRDSVRDAVWYDKADVSTRVERITRMFENMDLYNYNNPTHLPGIDRRLNQNFLVGVAIIRHQNNEVELAYGSTVPLWAFVPRAIWPDKPSVGGGGDIVSRYTGIYFPPGTSVGTGQPLEFYVNFEWWGLIIGFLLWGIILEHYDQGLARGLQESNVRKILLFGLPGLSLLQPGNNLMEILISFIASIVAAHITFFMLRTTGWIPTTVSPSRLPSTPRVRRIERGRGLAGRRIIR